MADHECNKGAIFRTREMGVGLRGLAKYNLEIGMLEERCLRRKESQGSYREERRQVVKR